MTHPPVEAALVLASLTSRVTGWIGAHGAYAVFAVMALDALLPVGGEVTMLFAGALAAGAVAGAEPMLAGHALQPGLESYVVLALAGTLGYLVGALVGWVIGRQAERAVLERHGRAIGVSSETFERAEAWFDRHGRAAVFLGRITPLVRSFISIPAGALGSPLGPYTALTLAGSAIWCFAFAGAGWALGSGYDSVHRAFRYVDVLVVAAAAVLVVLAVVHRRRVSRSRAPRSPRRSPPPRGSADAGDPPPAP